MKSRKVGWDFPTGEKELWARIGERNNVLN